ncbi:hypothetical protein ACIRBX_26335 [Kitasatospora sp. NPDC096147]|uniref:hypothetical protein n=1 Tax=Kitasatospora sp. NPDC096147 TaxID=3364093 RepID=UPI00382FA7D3
MTVAPQETSQGTSPEAVTLTIPSRFNGPATAGNGGYVCGSVAALARELGDGPAAVTLHAPVPVDLPLDVRRKGSRLHVWHGEELIASAALSTAPIGRVDPVDPAVARTSSERFGGHTGHPFPTCFVCGMERAAEDGLRLTPAPVPGLEHTAACLWRPTAAVAGPDGTVPPEIVWSVLDCPGGWTADPTVEPMVLGRMWARIDRLPAVGEECVVVARQDTRNGRTMTNTSTLYDAAGLPFADASAIWVAVNG